MPLLFIIFLVFSFFTFAGDQVEVQINSFNFNGETTSSGSMDVENIFLRVKGIEFETSKSNCQNCSQGLFDSDIMVTDDGVEFNGLFSLKIPSGEKKYISSLHYSKLRNAHFSLLDNKINLSADFFRFYYGDVDLRLSESFLNCRGINYNSELNLDFIMDSCFNNLLMKSSRSSLPFNAVLNFQGRKNLHVKSSVESVKINDKYLRFDLARAEMLLKNRYRITLDDSIVNCLKGNSVSSFVKHCQNSLLMTGKNAKVLNLNSDNNFKLELINYTANKDQSDVSFRVKKFIMPLGFFGNFSLNIDGFFGKCINFDLDKGFDESCYGNSVGALWGGYTKIFSDDGYKEENSAWLKKLDWSFSPEIKLITLKSLLYNMSDGLKLKIKNVDSRLIVNKNETIKDLTTFHKSTSLKLSLGSVWYEFPWINEDNRDLHTIFNVLQFEKSSDRVFVDIPYLFMTDSVGTTGLWGLSFDCQFKNEVDLSFNNLYSGCLKESTISLSQVYSHGREFKNKKGSLNIYRNVKMFHEAANKSFFKDKLSFKKLTAKDLKLTFFKDNKYLFEGKVTLLNRLIKFNLSGHLKSREIDDGRLEVVFKVEKSNLPLIGRTSRWVVLRVMALLFNSDQNDYIVVSPLKRSISVRL